MIPARSDISPLPGLRRAGVSGRRAGSVSRGRGGGLRAVRVQADTGRMGQDAGVVAGSPVRALLVRYAVTWVYLLGFIIAEVVFALLPVRDQAAVLGWASTN